jgi:hypothetical protein
MYAKVAVCGDPPPPIHLRYGLCQELMHCAVPQELDIGAIVSQRLTAMRKLQENPNDVQAISEMYHAQKGVSTAYSRQYV